MLTSRSQWKVSEKQQRIHLSTGVQRSPSRRESQDGKAEIRMGADTDMFVGGGLELNELPLTACILSAK